ncbi:MAG: MBL fold metallo-hydrolase [Chloroflexi bacterium]|nr:MBL fold metallo-hydrolase [Chloroflexota bacterium]
MYIRFLGTGAAEGIPAINCRCEHCTRARTRGGKLARERSAVLFSLPDYELLVDTPPHIGDLLAKHGVERIDGIFLTHEHYDHASGLADFAYWSDRVDLLVEKDLYRRLEHQGLLSGLKKVGFHVVCRQGVAIRFDGFFLTPFAVLHSVPCFGLVIYHEGRKIVHAADSSGQLTNYARRLIRGADLLIASTPFFESDGNHHLDVLGALRWKEELGIRNLILTHINHHNLPHDELVAYVGEYEDVSIAYDGMLIKI